MAWNRNNMISSRFEDFATSNLLSADIDVDNWGTDPNLETNNTIIYKVQNEYNEKGAIDKITLSDAVANDSLTVTDWKYNVIYVTLQADWTVTSYLWSDWDSWNGVDHPDIDTNTECIIARVWLYNNTGSDQTVWTANVDTFSTVIYENVVWPAL